MPPLPNTLYTRDTTCWIYGGVTLNPLYWPARHDETLLMKAIYTFHPDFVGADASGGATPSRTGAWPRSRAATSCRSATASVLIGMSERTSRQAITQVAAALFEHGAADRVIVAGMPKLRAAMHLDTVFTFADRDCVTAYRDDRRRHPHLLPAARATRTRVDVTEEKAARSSTSSPTRSDLAELRVVETGGDVYATERQQWDSGNNLVAARARRGLRLRPQHPHQRAAAQGGHRGHHHRRRRARPRPRRRPLHDLPAHPRPVDFTTVLTGTRPAWRRPG